MSGTGTPDYQLSYITDRLTIAVLKGIWHDQRLFYDVSGNIIYKCCHEMHKADTADETWEVWKFTWVGANCTRIEGPLKGSVDDRATLAWG